MAIKNYTTKIDVNKTIGEIQVLLAKHGASSTSVMYGEGGTPIGLAFFLDGRTYQLPARIEAVQRILEKQGVKCSDEQSQRVAWRNIKDWIDAQIALVETGQVMFSEVMFPYMLDGSGKTLYESLTNKILESGDE